jgi:hypothetical protein
MLSRAKDVRYVPDLGESIYSLFWHIQCPHHSLYSSYEGGLHIIFPTFQTKAILGKNDIYLDIEPVQLVDDSTNPSSSSLQNDMFCRNFRNFTTEVTKETKNLDNLLKSLCQYYKGIKTKWQLNLDIPAGFRQDSTLRRQIHDHHLIQIPQNNTSSLPTISDDIPLELSVDDTSLGPPITDSCPNNTSTNHVPILWCGDKVSSSLPSKITFTEDIIRASISFCRIDTIKNHLSDLHQPTICLDHLPEDAIWDAGEVATLHKAPRNTTPVPHPSSFIDVVHMDIVFGSNIALGNIHYGLLFTDRYSWMTYIYPLQNLTTDIKRQMKPFFAHLGVHPRRLISNFDTKSVGAKAREYLNSLWIHVNAAPANHQDKNGLVERHWQTMIAMARNWLASAELPDTFWFYAVKQAAEVCNYFPLKLGNG